MKPARIDVKDITKIKFELGDDHIGMSIDADFDEGWIEIRWNPEDWEKHSPNYSWTFNLTETLWKQLTGIIEKAGALDWINDSHDIGWLDDCPLWNITVMTSTAEFNRNISCDYPEGFWIFYQELETFCDNLYSLIKPDLSMVSEASIYHNCPDLGTISAQITERGLVLERKPFDKKVYLPLPDDQKKLADYLCNHPLDLSHQEWGLSEDKEPDRIFIEIKYSGYFSLNWVEELPPWAEDFFKEFWNLAVSLSSIPDRVRTDDYRSYLIGYTKPNIMTLSSSTKNLLITALPESSANCPLKDESDYHMLLDYLKKAWKKMTRSRAIGKDYDGKLLDMVDKAISELNGFNVDGFVQIRELNDVLLS